jgi:multidrug efflux system membrane fusion protein
VDIVLTLTTTPRAIVVPSQAVQTGQQGQYVFVVKADMTADMRPVVVSRSIGGETVIESGLQPGERVVTDGHLRLQKGAKVEIKQSATHSAPASFAAD